MNIKLSSSGWAEASKKEEFISKFVDARYRPELEQQIKTFDTQDSNIAVCVYNSIVCLVFTRREYYTTTQEAIERLQKVQEVELRFQEFLENLYVRRR